jgi:glycerol dehydrogenase-like iron-containing ADH family enzyme
MSCVSENNPRMIQASIFPGKYLQGANAIAELPSQVGRLGESALLVADIVAMKKYIPQVEAAFKRAKLEVIVEEFNGECCDSEIERLKKVAESRDCDVVIGMGGGKTMDTGKSVGHGLRRRVVTVPTIASTDAPTLRPVHWPSFIRRKVLSVAISSLREILTSCSLIQPSLLRHPSDS